MSLVSRCVKQLQNKCNFSIDHILNVAGEKNKAENFGVKDDFDDEKNYEWLNCTRYKPPKLQRQRKKDGVQRRKLGRNPRIPFSSSQVALLEAKYIQTPYLSSSDVTQLAASLQLSETRVKIWFQNRRARERRDRETKNKTSEASRNLSSQRLLTESREFRGLENVFMEKGFPPPSAESDAKDKSEQMNYYDSVRSVHIHNGYNFAQLFIPLDLSERQLMCK